MCSGLGLGLLLAGLDCLPDNLNDLQSQPKTKITIQFQIVYTILTLPIETVSARRWFSTCTPVSSTNKTGRHNITGILLRVALNTITVPSNHVLYVYELGIFSNITKETFELIAPVYV